MRPIVRSSLLLPVLLLAVAVPATAVFVSPAAAFALLALTVLEIAMAADSSVPMAGIASRIHSGPRRLFLSIGLVAGVLVMRLALPPAAVAVSTTASPADATAEAVLRPALFAEHLAEARPGIAAFGAVFIWLVFSEYFFNVDRAARARPWLGRFEAVAAGVRWPRVAAFALAGIGATLVSVLAPASTRDAVVGGSLIGAATYVVVKVGAARLLAGEPRPWKSHVHAATVVFERGLTVFMLFEILDGVYTLSSQETGLGLRDQALVAAAGVGIGAVFLARLTSQVDSARGLKRLRHLKAGAAYVLGVLSVLLWVSLVVPVPGTVAGWFGSVIIGLALLSSLPRLRRARAGGASGRTA